MNAEISNTETPVKVAVGDRFNIKTLSQRYGTLLVLVIVFCGLACSNGRFLTFPNILNISQQISMLTIVAVGLTFGFSVREMDLSVGFAAALGGILVPFMLLAGHSLAVSFVSSLIAGLGIGLVNAVLVVFIGVPSLIATLAVGEILFGINFVLTGGRAVYGDLPDSFLAIGQGQLLGIPAPALAMGFTVAVSWLVLQRTVFGRHLYAVGGNARAAELAGISISKYRAAGLVVSSLLATVAGVVLSARLGSGQPTAGDTYLLDGLAAVFIGMTMFRPGTATIMGTFFGALLIGVMNNGLNLLGVDTYYQSIVKGIIIVLAVSIVSRTTNLKLM
jgi:ribose/xylose/arabinose/galactoside ABC-type transport system permease subunit